MRYLAERLDPALLVLNRCRDCDFVFATERSADHVRHDHRYHASHSTVEDPVAATSNATEMLCYWATRLGLHPQASVLDVGCAEGRLVAVARTMGFHAQGIDVTDFYTDRWTAWGVDARVSTPEEFAQGHGGRFDLVVTRQVIEHVAEPVTFLASCASLLKANGVCLVETGDPLSVQARWQKERWSFWIPREGPGAHISFVGVKAARILAKRTTTELIDVVPHFRYRTLRSYGRENHRSTRDPRLIAKYWLHRTRLSGGRCYCFRRQ